MARPKTHWVEYLAALALIGCTIACSGGDPASPSLENGISVVAVAADAGTNLADANVATDAADDIIDAAICTMDFPDTCPSPPPSWMNGVRNLIVAYCSPCHFPNGVDDSKRDYSTFQGVHSRTGEIFSSVGGCSMPPSDSGQLTPAERETLFAWLVCGAPDN